MNKILVALLLIGSLLSCTKESDVDSLSKPVDHQLTVAVVAPLSDAATKARLERTAQWMLDDLRKEQATEETAVSLKLEWYDEQTEDMESLGSRLAHRSDVAAVIGPFDNNRMASFADNCSQTHKPLIAPTTTSEEVLRRYAVASAGESGQVNMQPFFWPLCQSDVTLTETMLSHFVTQTGHYASLGNMNCGVLSPADKYGQTFYEWAPFFTTSMDVSLQHNLQYTSIDDLTRQMTTYLEDLHGGVDVLLSNSFCVVESVRQLYEVVRLRREWFIRVAESTADNPVWDEQWQVLEALMRTWFVYSGLNEEELEALGSQSVRMLNGYQGFSPYADPSTGFEDRYEERYGVSPTFAECKLYDALLLVSLAARRSSDINEGIYEVAAADGASVSGMSGVIAFDPVLCVQLTPNTYVHWQIAEGSILHLTYYTRDGKQVVGFSVSDDLFYDEETALKTFAEMAADDNAFIEYAPLGEQYAVLVQGSHGMSNYRHQADVLSMYQLLRQGGFDDDHIILIIDKALATDQQNNEPGIIRSSPGGPDLLGGTDADKGYPAAVVDYDVAEVTPLDISQILINLPAGANTLLYWSGHGRNSTHGGVNELAWLDTEAGQGMTDDLLAETVKQMPLRQLLIILEPCYSEGVAQAIDGQPCVLALTGASGDEKSWAENWNPALGRYGTWMCDRFTSNVVERLMQNPATTYRDLYLYCMENTIGSHVKIVNAENFGNLYRNTLQEFIQYQKQ